MSRVQKSTLETAALQADDGAKTEQKQNKTRTIRLCFRDTVSGRDLLEGHVIQEYLPDDAHLDTVVIRGLKATAYSNPVGSNVVACVKLVDNTSIPLHECSDNESGWLHLNEPAPDGFTPMMNMLPYENSRKMHLMYKPTGAIKNEELINRYSGVTVESLEKEMVGMPDEDYYYVDKDSVICHIVDRNWDSLSISSDSSRTRDGRWVKIDRPIVDRVLHELNKNVLSKLPTVDLTNGLQMHFQADPHEDLNETAQYPISFEVALSYQTHGMGDSESDSDSD